jgi:hypothetical protein
MTQDKPTIRAALDAGESGPFNWTADVHTLTNSQRVDLVAMAKSVGYRKSVSSSLSLGSAFFVYLGKGMDAAPVSKGPAKRWNNHNISKG